MLAGPTPTAYTGARQGTVEIAATSVIKTAALDGEDLGADFMTGVL